MYRNLTSFSLWEVCVIITHTIARKDLTVGGSYDTLYLFAGMAELADALDLGSSAARRGGSNPLVRTIRKRTARLENVLSCFIAFHLSHFGYIL